MLNFISVTCARVTASRFLGVSIRDVRCHTTSDAPWAPLPFPVSMAAKRVPAVIRPVVPSPQLVELNVDDKAQPRTVILKAISAYIKSKNLQDPSDRRKVLCDEKLKHLFGVTECTFLEISKYVVPHLRKPEEVGGRYIEEAKAFEEAYLHDLKRKKKQEPKTRKAATAEQNQKRAARIFKPVILSKELAVLCDSKTELPRPLILKSIWEYIRRKKLHSGPGHPIVCDENMKKVFNKDEISVRTVMKGIGAHVQKKE